MKKISLSNLKENARKCIVPIGTTLSAFGTAASMTLVYAEESVNNGQKLIEFVISVLDKGMIAIGAVLAVMGVSKWAAAHADGDGPEMKKAQSTIAAAIIVVVVAAFLGANKSTISGLIV